VIRTETTKQACREITVEELEGVIELFGDGVVRAREAGYDGIELHAAHSYMLLGSFLSPLRNFRQDEYAGHSFEGRAKLLLQVLANIRSKVGADFPITLRISGFERKPGGREINDTQRLAPLLVEAGVDCFHVSGGVGDSNITQIITGPEYDPAYNLAAATAIKQVVDVSVMVVGQNMNPLDAEAILQQGRADIVAMGRALLADPELPNKARAGAIRDINRCILCQDCVDVMTTEGAGTRCAINPRCGREREYPIGPASTSKQVAIVGGGPGGLAAAQYAAERGHRVTLFESAGELGGAFRRAATVFPHNQAFLTHLIRRVESLPVVLRLGEAAAEANLRELALDAIIVATGGKVQAPKLLGDDASHVVKGPALHEFIEKVRIDPSVADALAEPVAIIGANLIGMELAECLAKLGKRIHLIEPTRRLATPAGKKRRGDHSIRLDTLGVPINTGIDIHGIGPEGIVIQRPNGKEGIIPAGTILIVGEIVGNPKFAETLDALAPEVYPIGDCTGFGLSKKAVAEAMATVYKL
jgi:2,4-dienoyl-CoA reductase (NADPH2)